MAVFFDLDGTLVDTAIDLGRALNQVLSENERPPLTQERVREVASHGSVAMLKAGFQIEQEQEYPDFKFCQQRFLELYRRYLTDHPVLMEGMDEVIRQLTEAGMPWGIVTNKPAWLTQPLVDVIDVASPPFCVVSGDTVSRSKPYPDPLLHACQCLRVPAERCIYVGDAKRDIQAGRAAGMRTIAASFGYLSARDTPESWGADYIIDLPAALLGPILTTTY